MNIYCGNLSYDVTDSMLKEAFGSFGEVSEANVISDRVTGRSKGFGFVVMPNEDEAQAAMTALDGSDLMGRSLKVNQAKPRNDRF
ncbi:MAG: RNA-binding protein [Ignavibacteria bacterium]|nr:MAG: RNA-binding protein [Ignavibacteria bacterium]